MREQNQEFRHGPISTPESFNRESDRLGWRFRLEHGPTHQGDDGWRLVERDGGALVFTCSNPNTAAALAVFWVERHMDGT